MVASCLFQIRSKERLTVITARVSVPKRQKRQSACFPLHVRNDAALWKHASLQAALAANTATVAALIQAGREKSPTEPAITEAVLEQVL